MTTHRPRSGRDRGGDALYRAMRDEAERVRRDVAAAVGVPPTLLGPVEQVDQPAGWTRPAQLAHELPTPARQPRRLRFQDAAGLICATVWTAAFLAGNARWWAALGWVTWAAFWSAAPRAIERRRARPPAGDGDLPPEYEPPSASLTPPAETVEDEPAVGDLVSDIAAEVAAEEHRQGRVRRPIAGHCGDCDQQLAAKPRRRRAAAATVPAQLDPTVVRRDMCPHIDTTDTRDGRGRLTMVRCNACGATGVNRYTLGAGIDPDDPPLMQEIRG